MDAGGQNKITADKPLLSLPEADTANAGYTETPANGSDGLRPGGL